MLDPAECSTDPKPLERRRGRRQRTLLHGKLISLIEGVSQDCTIRNLSDAGAHLETAAPAMLTAHSFVVVTKTGAAHELGLVWRREAHLGVRFTATHDLNQSVPAGLGGLRRLWVENKPR